MNRCSVWLLMLCCMTLLAACATAPDYRRPELDLPAGFAHAVADAEGRPWEPARPQMADGAWWRMFADAALNELMQQLDAQNPDIRMAEARLRRARALAQGARAAFFPSLGATLSATRGTTSRGRDDGLSHDSVSTVRRVALEAGWEADIWGRLRRTAEAENSTARAAAAELAGARLSAQAELALSYFQLRNVHSQQQLLERKVAAYEKLLQMARNRYAAGVAGRADVEQARTQLHVARAEVASAELARIRLSNAIAIQLGVPPEQFALPSAATIEAPLATTQLPQVPPGIPAQLLQRRPDIASAEFLMIAANARIGVAKAAYYPALTLTASGGYQGGSDWLASAGRFWGLGPAMAAPLFDGGQRRARALQAQAEYDEAVGLYARTVLGALREVEDNLAALQLLEHAANAFDAAVQSAHSSQRIASNQYKVGKVSLLDVLTLQAIAFDSERSALQLLAQRYAVCIGLIRSLGGGWDVKLAADAAD
jgi:NodT family efflux transporter outer membrane factor (OMF) lipoprotein